MKRFFLMCAFAFSSTTVYAGPDRGFYTGASAMLVDIGLKDTYEKDVEFKVAELMLGYKFHDLLGIEGRVGKTLNGENVAFGNQDGSGREEVVYAEIDYFSSVYYRAEIKNDIAKVYTLLGTAYMSVSSEFEDEEEVENTSSGFSYGMGAGLLVGDSFYFNIEAKSLIHTDKDNFVGYSANITLHF